MNQGKCHVIFQNVKKCIILLKVGWLWSLTWLTLFSLALFEGIVDVYEGEVIAFRMLELSVTQGYLVGHVSRWLQEAAWS